MFTICDLLSSVLLELFLAKYPNALSPLVFLPRPSGVDSWEHPKLGVLLWRCPACRTDRSCACAWISCWTLAPRSGWSLYPKSWWSLPPTRPLLLWSPPVPSARSWSEAPDSLPSFHRTHGLEARHAASPRAPLPVVPRTTWCWLAPGGDRPLHFPCLVLPHSFASLAGSSSRPCPPSSSPVLVRAGDLSYTTSFWDPIYGFAAVRVNTNLKSSCLGDARLR